MTDKPDKGERAGGPEKALDTGDVEAAFNKFVEAAGVPAAQGMSQWVTLDGAVAVQPEHPVSGQSGRLVHFKHLARGGMASILTARDENLQRTVAVKQVTVGSEEQERDMGRLIAEAQILAQLDHPHIVPVYELSAGDGGDIYYTMKLVRGRNLAEILDQQDCLFRTPGELFDLLQIFTKVCDAVSFAHSRGVVHRDLKPENIMVGEYGEVYLMDWGIALLRESAVQEGDGTRRSYGYKKEQEGRIVGSPGFMPSEQVMGKISEVDARSDVFSLGAVLYCVMTNTVPFIGRTMHETLENTVRGKVRSPQDVLEIDLPQDLCRITMKALAKDPVARYQSVAELKAEVESFLQCGWQFLSRVYAPGEVIITEGDVGTEAYVISEGQCRVTKKQVDGGDELLADLGPGEVFGETAILTDMPRSASVQALDRVTVMVVSRDQLQEAMGTGFFLGRLIRGLAQRFRARDDQATALGWQAREAELSMAVLSFLNFSGTTVDSDRRVGCWSTLRRRLLDSFDIAGQQLMEMLERMEMFSIDTARDTISLKKME